MLIDLHSFELVLSVFVPAFVLDVTLILILLECEHFLYQLVRVFDVNELHYFDVLFVVVSELHSLMAVLNLIF